MLRRTIVQSHLQHIGGQTKTSYRTVQHADPGNYRRVSCQIVILCHRNRILNKFF